MVPRCSVCSHSDHLYINRSLLAGVPYRTLAAKYGLSSSALCRHVKHLTRQSERHPVQQDRDCRDSLMEKLDLLHGRLNRIFDSALDLRSLNISLGCIRESLRLIALLDRFRLDHRART